MRTEYFIPVILFFPVIILQITFIPLISVYGIIPDLVIILLVFYTIQNGQIYGTILGFILGLLFDLITGGLLGSSIISKTCAGFTAGYFSNENKRDFYLRTYMFSVVVLAAAVIDSVVNSVFSSIDLRANFLQLVIEQGFFPGLYTALLSVIIVIFMPKRSFT